VPLRARSAIRRPLALAALLACAALTACSAGDPSPGLQDVTFGLQIAPEPTVEQGESAAVAIAVIDDDSGDGAGDGEAFTADVELRALPPLPPGINVDFSAAAFAPNQPGTLNIRTTGDAQAGRHQLVVEARIRNSSTRYYRSYEITVVGNCGPGTESVDRILPANFSRSIALTGSGRAYLVGANQQLFRDRSSLTPATRFPVAPQTIDFHTAQLIDALGPVSSAASRAGISAFVLADSGVLMSIAYYFPSGVVAPNGRAGWATQQIDAREGFSQVVASTGFADTAPIFYAMHEDGTVWSFEADSPAVDEEAESGSPFHVEPLEQVVGVADAKQLAAGGRHLLVRRSDASVLALGTNDQGQLGDPAMPHAVSLVVADVSGVVDVAAGTDFSLAVLADGTVLAWGRNAEGQLGRGSPGDPSGPEPVTISSGDPLQGIVAVAAGTHHALALDRDGSVWSWGRGDVGQLGGGVVAVRPHAERIANLTATHVSAADDSSFAVLASGRVQAWGANGRGQLGDGTRSERDVPTHVLGLGFGDQLHCRDRDVEPPPPVLPGWHQLGPAVSDVGATPSLALDSAQRPLVAFVRRDSSNTDRLHVRRFVDGAWQDVGAVLNPELGVGAMQPALAVDSQNRPVVAWVQLQPDLNLLMVARFNGTAWERLCGRNGFCDLNYEVDGRARWPSLTLDANGQPAVAWIESDVVSAKRFDGTTWRAFDAGPRPISAELAQRVRIAFARDGTGYLAWTLRDALGVDLVRVARADATTWTQLADVPRPDAGDRMPDLGFAVPVTRRPIVSWVQTGGLAASIHAARWDGSWAQFGNEAYSVNATFEGFAFALSSTDLPWIAMAHVADGVGRLDMRRFDGGAWIPMALFHGRLSALSMVLPSSGPIDSPHFAWVQNGAVEVWRWVP
jgi:hypothetical protein